MKGAAPVDPSTTSSPTRDRTSRIGISHHFLFSKMKSRNSSISEGGFPCPASSKAVRGALDSGFDSWYMSEFLRALKAGSGLTGIRGGAAGLLFGPPVRCGLPIDSQLQTLASHDLKSPGQRQADSPIEE